MSYPECRAYVAQKGGVGKSSSAVVDAAEGVRRGLRVLFIDLDPQANGSVNLGVARAQTEELPENQTLVGVFRGAADLPEVVFESPSVPGLDVAPATVDLSQIEADATLHGVGGKLRRQLAKHEGLWDLVIIDLPPSLGRLTYTGIAAANSIVVPFELAGQSIEALVPVMATIEAFSRLEDQPNPPVWILPTKADFRTTLHNQAYEAVKSQHGPAVLKPIRNAIKVVESYGARLPVTLYAPESNASEDYLEALETVYSQQKVSK